jgi:ATP-binding cassette subfamily B protein
MFLKLINKTRFPIVKQYNLSDCGAAALLSILRYYGGDTNIVYMRELTKTDKTGTRLIDIVNAAKKLGFKAYGAKGSYDDLIKEKMPCIAHVIKNNNLQHYVVVYKINSKEVLIGDPAQGLQKLKRPDFEKLWKKNTVVLLRPESDLYYKQQESRLKHILKYLSKHNSWVYQSLFLGGLYTLGGLIISVFIRIIIDKLIPRGNTTDLIYTGFFLLGIMTIKSFIGYYRRKFLVILDKKLMININTDFLEHIFHLPKTFFDKIRTGDITARVNDLSIIQRAVILIINTTIIDIIMVIGAIGFMFIFSKILALIILAIVPVYFLILYMNTNKIKMMQYEVMKNHAFVESKYIDCLKGISDILNFSVSNSFIKINEIIFTNYQEQKKKLGLKVANLNLLAEHFNSILSIVLLIVGAINVIAGNLQIGQMMAAFSLFSILMPSIANLVNAHVSLAGAQMAFKRLSDIFLVEKEKNINHKKLDKIKSLAIKNGTFTWAKNEKPLLKNISIKLIKGRITGLFGSNGSGKTTITKILNRIYQLNSGVLYVNGKRANNFDLYNYRKKIGLIPQSIKIFSGTILDNILIGRKVSNIKEVNKFLSEYNLLNLFDNYKNRIFTLIGENNRELSGGEKHIIAFARALFENPDVLIIDEGISGIDLNVRKQLIEIIRQYSEKNAILLISHNLRIMQYTDYLYILKNGEIIKEGVTSKLIKAPKPDNLFKENIIQNVIS